MRMVVEHRSRPCPGEQASGDAILVRHSGKRTLVAVVDALGHGPEAAKVSAAAVASMEGAPLDQGVESILTRLHTALRGSRGAAAMLCLLHEGNVEGAGVGNVDLRSVGTRLPVRLSAGILGSRWPRLHVFTGVVQPGHRLIFFSDGISQRFSTEVLRGRSAQEAAIHLLQHHASPIDDATVLVADLEEES